MRTMTAARQSYAPEDDDDDQDCCAPSLANALHDNSRRLMRQPKGEDDEGGNLYPLCSTSIKVS